MLLWSTPVMPGWNASWAAIQSANTGAFAARPTWAWAPSAAPGWASSITEPETRTSLPYRGLSRAWFWTSSRNAAVSSSVRKTNTACSVGAGELGDLSGQVALVGLDEDLLADRDAGFLELCLVGC